MEDTMKKVIILCMFLALSFSTYSCGGGGAGSSSSPDGENPKTPSIVKLMPSHYVAQTNSFISLHTKVLDGNGKPVPNTPVTYTNLSNPFGNIISSMLKSLGLYKPVGMLSTSVVRTDKLGIATVKITSTVPGFATVQSEVNTGAGIVRDKKTVYFTLSLVTTTPPPTLKLHVDDGDGTYDEPDDYELFKTSGDTQRTIKAVLLDGFGRPLSGKSVTFGSDSPNEVNFLNTNPAMTNNNGEAFILIQVNPAIITDFTRVLNITAQYSENNDTAAAMLTLFLDPVTVSNISVTANPSVVAPNGTSTINATVYLNTGTKTPDNSTVNFTTSCGTVIPFAQTTNGIATATFTAPSIPPSNNICTITASIGGQIGTADVRVTTSLTVQPGSQTINGVNGGNATYIIFGGVAPYTVTTNNRAIACNDTNSDGDCSDPSDIDKGIWNVPASSNQFFSVTVPANTPASTVTLVVRDSVGTTVNATLTIGGGASLAILPNTVTVYRPSTADDNLDFTIFGGISPYSVFSNNPLYAPVVLTSNTFRISVPANATTGAIIITVRDNSPTGTTTTATITITAQTPQPLVVIPSTQTISNPAPTDTADYKVLGGTGGYTAFSGSPSLVSVTVGGADNNIVTATLQAGVSTLTTDTTVTITIYDSVGSNITASLVLDIVPTLPLSVTPESVSVTGLASTTDDNVTFFISGGSGTYTGVSNNTAVVPNPTIVGNNFTIDPQVVSASTPVTLTVVDSLGATDTATVTVTPATSSMAINPSTITVDVGTVIAFNIIGGLPNYSVYTSDMTVLALASNPEPVSGTSFTATASADGSATITVVDSDGQTVTATVTVTAPPTPPTPSALSVAPPSATICEDSIACSAATDVAAFTISGGVAPYTVTSLTPSVIPNPITVLGGGIFAVNATNGSIAADTPVILTITDSASGGTTVTVTVINQP